MFRSPSREDRGVGRSCTGRTTPPDGCTPNVLSSESSRHNYTRHTTKLSLSTPTETWEPGANPSPWVGPKGRGSGLPVPNVSPPFPNSLRVLRWVTPRPTTPETPGPTIPETPGPTGEVVRDEHRRLTKTSSVTTGTSRAQDTSLVWGNSSGSKRRWGFGKRTAGTWAGTLSVVDKGLLWSPPGGWGPSYWFHLDEGRRNECGRGRRGRDTCGEGVGRVRGTQMVV